MPTNRRTHPPFRRGARALYARLATKEQTVQDHQRAINTLQRIAALVLREQPLPMVLHEVAQEVSACTGFPIVVIELYDAHHQQMELVAATGIPLPADPIDLRVSVNQTLSGRVARGGQALIETRARERAEYADLLLRRDGMQSIVCLPLANADRVIGTLSLAHPDALSLDADLVPLAQSLANMIATLVARRQAEAGSGSAERELREILDKLAAGVVQIDADGRYLYVNQRAAADFGLTPAQMIGKSIFDVLTPDAARYYFERNRRFIAAQGFEEREETFELPIGPRTFFIADQVLTDAEGVGRTLLASTVDITARKADEEALRRSERTFRELYEHMRDAFVMVDMEGRIRQYNRSFQEMLGYSDDELARLTYQELTPARWHAVEERIVQEEILLQGYSAVYEKEYRRKDGSIFPIELRTVLVHDNQGRPTGIWGIIRDITERRQAEALVIAQRDLARMITTATTPEDAWPRCIELAQRVAGMDSGGIYLFDAGYQELELVYHQGLGEDFLRMVTRFPTDSPNAQLVLSGQAPYYTFTQAEMVMLGAPIEEGLSSLAIIPIHEHGRMLGCINLASHTLDKVPDVARQALETIGAEIGNMVIYLRTTAALRAEQLRLARVADTVPGAIISFRLRHDSTLYIPYASRAFEELYGLTLADVADNIDAISARVPAKQLTHLMALAHESARTLQPWHHEYQYQHPTKGLIWLEGYSMPVREPDGSTVWHGFTTDITERKQAEAQLRELNQTLETRVAQRTAEVYQANAELARAARAKDEFLATMSHELRSPLNVILAMSESLQEAIYGPLGERQQTAISHIEASGRHLLSLINDILDLSKVEAGRLELQIEPIILTDICQASLLFVKELALKKGLKLTFRLNDEQAEMEADPRRLKQILVNLLSNAVKFTPSGGEVSMEVMIDDLAGIVRFAVRDTGIGITPDELVRLFQPFVQLDSSLNRQHEGTGLGLALVRRLAELHGGSVTVESELGVGSCFTLTLPHHPPTSVEEQPQTPTLTSLEVDTRKRQTALVVEDSAIAADQVARYLHEMNLDVVIHLRGTGALEHATQLQPDVIILDLLMPEHTGWEVLAQLKANPRTRNIPVIIVSIVDDRARGLAAGAADHLIKPVSRELLRQALRAATSVYDERLQALSREPQPAQANPLILIAEDNEMNLEMTSEYLYTRGFSVIVARDGREALAAAVEQRPDLILMDIQMPEIDGLELTRHLRTMPEFATTPIIALTALAMSGDRERCLEAGANDYMTKPVSMRALVESIKRLLKR